MYKNITIEECPEVLRDAVEKEILGLIKYSPEIISVTYYENENSNGKNKIYKVYLMYGNVFNIMTFDEYTHNKFNVGVSQNFIIIGEINEILKAAPQVAESMQPLISKINEINLIKNYKELLKSRYESFKTFLFAENFVPPAEEVWSMYSKAFDENNGIYHLLASSLNLKLYDDKGRLNECHIYLDAINKDLSNLCSEYIEKILPKL